MTLAVVCVAGVGFDLKLPDPRPVAAPVEKNDKTEKSSGKASTTR